MKKVKLHNGYEMPLFGLGTFLAKENEAYEAVKYALSIGYRQIDTAQMYLNEALVGKAIKDSGVDRKDVFITTKQRGHSNLDNMKKAFDESLERLGTDYVDLYLIHWPNHDKKINQQTWKFFESIYKAGRAKAIGISNFQIHHIEDLLETAEIVPMVNQVETHPGLSQVPLKKYLDSKKIQLESYGPFMRGGIFEGQWGETLGEIAKTHDASIPQIVIAWGLQRNIVMIPKSVTASRIKDNYDAQKITLTEEEMNKINDLNRGKRIYTDPDNSPWGPYVE